MASLANIVINDGQATPVAHTFIPVGVDKNGVILFEDRAVNATYNPAGVPLLFPRISASITRAPYASQTAKNRVKFVITRPKQLYDAYGSAAGIAAGDEPDCIIEFRGKNASTDADRNDVLQLAKNLLSNAIVVDMIKAHIQPY